MTSALRSTLAGFAAITAAAIFGFVRLPASTVLTACTGKTSPVFVSAECGTVRVFENRATRLGRMIDIHFARWRAQTAAPSGVVMLLAGGPGSTGDGLAGAVDGWARPLRSTMDIVVVDQRGTGLSNTLFCARDVQLSPATAFGHIFDDNALRACRIKVEEFADPKQYITDFAADDLDEVRAALGYDRVSLYGGSYGTRLAQSYMRRFPTRTRSVVLDGVLPFDIDAPLTYARTAQSALDRVIQQCVASLGCRLTHPFLARYFGQVLERFRAGPVRTMVTPAGRQAESVPMSLGDFGYAVRGILYDVDGARALPEMIMRAAKTGDLSEFAQHYWERALSFSRTFSDGLHLSVLCTEDVSAIRSQDVGPATVGTFLGTYVIDEYRRACGLWQTDARPPDFTRPASGSIPTLLVSGYFDPVTPPEFAERVATTLSVSRHLVWKQGAHVSVTGCALPSALHVLGTGTLDTTSLQCR